MAGAAVKVLAGEVIARLKGMEQRGGNLRGVMRAFGQYMLGSIEENFARGGRPRWPPLAAGTLLSWGRSQISWKTKRGGISKAGEKALAGRLPLTDTARLRRSIRVGQVTPASVTIGTNVIYAAIHQFGGKAGRGRKVTIPARPYLVFQDADLQRANEMIAGYVITGVIP